MREVRRWRVLLAHDTNAATCDPLLDALPGALGNVDVYESSSVDDARDALSSSLLPLDPIPDGPRFDLCLVCLDLPPAPTGGARLAQELLEHGLPVVLVTRSLRWLPPWASALRELPWVTPDAGEAEVSRAVGEAMARMGGAAPDVVRGRAAAGA